MKKAIILAILLSIILSACSSVYEIHGLHNFNINDCNMGLTKNLLPNESFLVDYPYSNGDYHFYENKLQPKTLMILQYDSDIYDGAKEHCLRSFVLIGGNCHEFGEYCFVENNTYWESNGKDSRYPEWFNMFGYNDETQTLFFLGYYVDRISDEDRILATTDFQGFLTKHFGEYYDFSQ